VSLLSIFTPKSPTIAGYEFDAVLEDTFEASADLTGYPIELGARASDHRIVNPFRWSIVGAVSNTPLSLGLGDFATSFIDSPLVSTAFGLSSSFLAGSNETRGSATLEFLVGLLTTGEPFDIDAGDIQLTNMVIARIRRTKDPVNEGGLIFEADLQEYPTLSTVITKNQPLSSQLNPNDPSSSQASATNNIGEIKGVEPTALTTTNVTGVLG